MPRGRPFPPGNRANPKGRPKGIIDRRLRLNKALMGQGDALLATTIAAALGGDMTAMSILLPRMMPTLKPEGSPVRFPLNVDAPLSDQIAQVTAAVANGQLTIEEGERVANMIRALAEAKAAEGSGEAADRLTQAFREMAQVVDKGIPYTPPPGRVTALAPTPPAPAAPVAPRKYPMPWEK
jgi:hypothetical protein